MNIEHRLKSLQQCTKARLLHINEDIREARKKNKDTSMLKSKRIITDKLLSAVKLAIDREDYGAVEDLEDRYKRG